MQSLVSALVGLCCCPIGADVLYDAAKNSLPEAQGWVYLTQPFSGGKATQRLEQGRLLLDTVPDATDTAGYFSRPHPKVTKLDRGPGFTVAVTARLVEERHARPIRAGFSLLVLSEDLWGLELAFWSDEIWAQSGADFKHAEGAKYDTTSAMRRYELRMHGEQYTLSVEGKALLSGRLRNYATHPHPVYRQKSLIFLGDDTRSAAARVEIGRVELDQPMAAPAPAAPASSATPQ
jgi:hypothetical protein